MYQYHGWAVLSISVDDESNHIEDSKMLLQVQNYISKLKDNIDIIEVKAINGQYHFLMTGFANHKIISEYNPINIFRHIGILASGSYGILYVYDDEDLEYFNEFRVYVLTRGDISEKSDTYLSPLIPTVANKSKFEIE